MRAFLAPLFFAALAACGADSPQPGTGSPMDQTLAFATADVVLDKLHAFAAEADGDAYFALFDDDAIFYGTDATERWTLAEFRAYAEPHFSEGKGWSYTMLERNLFFGPAGETVWFDERLSNEKYGEVRGTGVLVRRGQDWRIAQYNLAFPVPNEVAGQVVELISAHQR